MKDKRRQRAIVEKVELKAVEKEFIVEEDDAALQKIHKAAVAGKLRGAKRRLP